jgi:hypothetical protein
LKEGKSRKDSLIKKEINFMKRALHEILVGYETKEIQQKNRLLF